MLVPVIVACFVGALPLVLLIPHDKMLVPGAETSTALPLLDVGYNEKEFPFLYTLETHTTLSNAAG